jgi:hypothetical protein
MAWTREQRRKIYDRTSGYCHLCHRKMSFTNYGSFGERGAWEVEHSIARANGGTNHGNNLFGAHISCNRAKCDGSTRAARAAYGKTRAPLCKEARDGRRAEHALTGAGAGALVGLIFGGAGAVIGALLGGVAGASIEVR